MSKSETLRIANSPEQLDKLLTRIESGQLAKPDWIRLQGRCRLDDIKEAEREKLLARLHGNVLRGFRDTTPEPSGRSQRLALWQSIARSGFHDFSELGWMKCYDSPFVENYDYISAYQQGGIDALDPYAVYSSVLGTFDFGVADFVETELCRDVRTIVEPMAGTAEFSYAGHFRYPDFHYYMIDLDEDAQRRVLTQRWLPTVHKEYIVENILSPQLWERIKASTVGESLAYIGKQSHHILDTKQLMTFMKLATQHVDYLMLETPQICLVSDMGDTDELTRQEQEDAGFDVELVGEKNGEPNPLTHLMAFRLEASKGEKKKTMFDYHDWTSYAHSTLVAFADLLDLNSFYFHSDEEKFLPVSDWRDDADCEENVTFMLFTRRSV